MEKFSRSGHPLAECGVYLRHVATELPTVPYHVWRLSRNKNRSCPDPSLRRYAAHLLLSAVHPYGDLRPYKKHQFAWLDKIPPRRG